MSANPDLLRGTLDTVLLDVVGSGVTYGYEIAAAVRTRSSGALVTQEGTLYPALHRLEKRGLLKSRWGVSPQGRRRKHYELTAKGRRHLETSRREFASFVKTVGRMLGIAHAQPVVD